MDLATKLQTISNPKIPTLKSGHNKTLSEFWDDFVVPLLPDPDIVKQWYNLLLRYVQDDNAVFAIRSFGSAKDSTCYHLLRRGFYNTTDNGYSLFYTDNFFAAYFTKMAMDGYVPDYDEFKQMMISREFPARFGPHDSKYELVKAAYDITGKKGKDPMINTQGYKIAHIFDVGKNFCTNGCVLGMEEICQRYCPRGDYNDWEKTTDVYGEFYVRHLGKLDDIARKIFAAHFLRVTCPLNYVLTPQGKLHTTPVCRDIAEYSHFQQYAMKKFYDMYGDTYKDFISNIMTNIDIDNLTAPDEDIDIEYGLHFKQSAQPITTVAPNPTGPATKSKSISKADVQHIIGLCHTAGHTTFYNVRYASLNTAKDVYWLNPVEKDFTNGFTLLCFDTRNREVHVFNITANDVDINKLRPRTSQSGIKFNVEIRYNDATFTDIKSGVQFDKYLVCTLKY